MLARKRKLRAGSVGERRLRRRAGQRKRSFAGNEGRGRHWTGPAWDEEGTAVALARRGARGRPTGARGGMAAARERKKREGENDRDIKTWRWRWTWRRSGVEPSTDRSRMGSERNPSQPQHLIKPTAGYFACFYL
jgi:hypothetical protein